MHTPEIKKFTDYRAFLLAYVQDCRRSNPRWSYGVFTRQLGLKDPSSITKIIQGQREPGAEITGKLIRHFNFKSKDAQYFEDLIRLRKIKDDPRLAVMLLEKMGKDHPNGALRILDDQSFQLISNWYCLAIREMARLDDFVADPQWISKRMHFKVTPTDAAKAIEILLNVGLLERDGKNLRIRDGRFHTSNDRSSEAIKRYHESMLDIAKTALRKFDVSDREFTASTLTLKAERFPEAKELIREFKSRFAKLLEEDGGDVTAQLQIQFFPLTPRERIAFNPIRIEIRRSLMKFNPSLLFIALALPLGSAQAAKEGGVGNGGIAFVCRDTQGKITRAELLDLWEPIRFKVPRSNEDIDVQIERAIQWIGAEFPTRVNFLRERIAYMKARTIRLVHDKKTEDLKPGEYLVDASKKLESTEDALPVYNPSRTNCGYEQVARYDRFNELGLRLAIEAEIYDSPHFSNTDRAALYLHEVIYDAYVTARAYYLQLVQEYPHWDDKIVFGVQPRQDRHPHSRFARHAVSLAFWNQEPLIKNQYVVKNLRWTLVDDPGEYSNPVHPVFQTNDPVLYLRWVSLVPLIATTS